MRRLLLLLVASALLLAPRSVDAQTGECNLIESVRYEESVQGGVPIVTITGPFLFRCADGTELRADFGTLNQASRELFLNGNVFFRDPERQATANQARYSSVIRRLHGTGDVVFTDLVGGSVLRGPEVEYYRVMPGRPLTQVIAPGRPHVTLVQRGRVDQEPFEVDADRVTIVGEDQFSAVGQVIIRRSDLDATANEASYSQATSFLELRGNAQVDGEQFQLVGERIEAVLPEGGIERVLARRNAHVVGDDLRVQAPELQLFFAQDSLQRMVARGRTDEVEDGRATAVSRTFRLDADSLDARMPGQRLEQVIAIGRARGETRDTTGANGAVDLTAPAPELPEISTSLLTDRDWILGDTIIGHFSTAQAAAPPARADTTQTVAPRDEVQLDRIVARGEARSLYRIARNEEGEEGDDRPALNYLAGDTIELTLAGGELEVANVEGLRRGVYLEPSPPPAAETEATPETPAPLPTAARARSVQRGRP